jgi:hypothetical protein
MKMQILLQGFLAGAGLAAVLVIFEYMAITREVAERSKRMAKKVDWDQNQRSRMRGMIRFGIILPIGGAIGAWWVWG